MLRPLVSGDSHLSPTSKRLGADPDEVNTRTAEALESSVNTSPISSALLPSRMAAP